MMYRLRTPVVMQAPENAGLFSRFTVPRGLTLKVAGATVTAVQCPTQDELNECDWYLLGGHECEVTDEQASVISAAGFGDCLEAI